MEERKLIKNDDDADNDNNIISENFSEPLDINCQVENIHKNDKHTKNN